ncbi:bifunctional diaminohydroxyphosphoribosylaminopyrimidine deaminase/5-amino-6-(5-phosphoribosylamino)uracil reductase RibD [Agrobacterium tumefaciens]|uniref:bifunctional diaminohydroxyphosphoribosylaminopyrimidine deaminase/5-amino-6-(5-phosphoribosylamino)uracil reductase RibD n=3 Tax=Rhizobium/Agrobacterium group TaxID=227290 RepID=UPI0003F21437|nr:bifunctional diaminohydroxyphosphoribosylaminopyrimidine deaminase/5-amino-6-(5-phosphoribosylamino)uracil reductase RibD [Agrobacterium tumefaciens]AHK01048.1 diaminohydroxyphosphoribosylaminopyrimidinedeaminase [Agrobacterium tumefaciens LBA4213 (Ach5)]AKC06859.1 bifunctional riboflavin deaminase-reductase [Agrobacterium tumefaciens]AYM15765.1 bifunctional riboflavin deaminase-reductase [Agrobacterium tumefaciens]AYM67000.1 bifunctional riboflavin deaminase-reductase [Agrobacterium tumefac
MTSRADDEKFMARAIEVSLRHQGQTQTNPSVGCVLVKDGKIIAEAVTAIGGRPHAERQALEIAGEAARGATAYVTLEPCSHWGKTPPCANALVEFGVARVVVAVDDPDERVSGRGYTILRDAGIVVETGLLREQGKRALAGYLTRQLKKRPHVILKLAISADGMIGRQGEGQVAITGPQARHAVHQLRARCDCILVGIRTAIADDPELTVRIAGLEDRSPVRIVLDRKFELPLTSKLVGSAREVPVIVAALSPSDLPGILPSRGEMPGRPEGVRPDHRRQQLIDAGVEILEAPTLENLLHILAERGMSELLVEGGAFAAKSFLEADLVDRIMLFESPVVVGEGGIETPLSRADIPGDYVLVSETAYGPDRCFDYERPL